MQVLGRQLLIELQGCDPKRIADVATVESALRAAAKATRATILEVVTRTFRPQGVSSVVVIAESHLAIHTWPEHGYAAVDLFTCGETAQPRVACDYLVQQFKAADYSLKVIPRGAFARAETPAPSAVCDDRNQEAGLCPVQN